MAGDEHQLAVREELEKHVTDDRSWLSEPPVSTVTDEFVFPFDWEFEKSIWSDGLERLEEELRDSFRRIKRDTRLTDQAIKAVAEKVFQDMPGPY